MNTQINLKKLGEIISKARIEKNFSRQFLTENLDFSEYHLGRIERGQTDPKITELDQIAHLLGLSLPEVIYQSTESFVIRDSLEYFQQNAK